VKKALASAWLAAVVVHTALTDREMVGPALAFHQEREREMYRTLGQVSASLASPAQERHQSAFWRARVNDQDDTGALETQSGASGPVAEARVRAALDELRARDRVRLRVAARVARAARPVVIGNRIALRDHLVSPLFPAGVRYLRNVDVVLLSELAAAHDQVGKLYGTYARAAAPVPLPDFLGALATMIGAGALTLD
jgi:hypothetical protein